jgi:hypothetical protein
LLVSGYSAAGETIVVRSTDGGASYQPVTALPGFQNAVPWILSTAPNLEVTLAVFEGCAIAVSRDGAASWTIDTDTLCPVSAGVAYLSPTQSKVFWGDISGALYSAPYGALH